MAAREIGDDAVKRATGRDWKEWLELLDQAGAKTKPHREIAAIAGELGATPWWRQMVTVTYERERGLREVHQTAAGYVANVSRTFGVPVEELFDAFRRIAKKERYAERKATAPKSLRLTAPDATSVEVGFYAKGESKSSIAVQHSKLTSQKDVAARKKYWGEVLGVMLSRNDGEASPAT